MDLFTQNNLYKKWLLFFLILNFSLIGLLIYLYNYPFESQKPEKDIAKVTKKLQKELELSNDQMSQLILLREDFFRKEQKLKKQIRNQRDSMNLLMFNKNTDTIYVKEIARRVADNEYQMELYRIEQAIELKRICTPEQMSKFEGMVKLLRDYFKPIKQK